MGFHDWKSDCKSRLLTNVIFSFHEGNFKLVKVNNWAFWITLLGFCYSFFRLNTREIKKSETKRIVGNAEDDLIHCCFVRFTKVRRRDKLLDGFSQPLRCDAKELCEGKNGLTSTVNALPARHVISMANRTFFFATLD